MVTLFNAGVQAEPTLCTIYLEEHLTSHLELFTMPKGHGQNSQGNTYTTRLGAPTRQEAEAIIIPTPTGHTTMPTVMGAHTTTQAQVVKDQPHTPHQHPPEDHLRVPRSQSEKIHNVYGQLRRQQKLKWVPTAAM